MSAYGSKEVVISCKTFSIKSPAPLLSSEKARSAPVLPLPSTLQVGFVSPEVDIPLDFMSGPSGHVEASAWIETTADLNRGRPGLEAASAVKAIRECLHKSVPAHR